MSDTPRTDVAIVREHINPAMERVVRASFARELERENAALRTDAEELANALRDVLAGHPVRNADELIARYSPLPQSSACTSPDRVRDLYEACRPFVALMLGTSGPLKAGERLSGNDWHSLVKAWNAIGLDEPALLTPHRACTSEPKASWTTTGKCCPAQAHPGGVCQDGACWALGETPCKAWQEGKRPPPAPVKVGEGLYVTPLREGGERG